MHMESETPDVNTLRLTLLGPLTLYRDGAPVALPASRKVRALFAYLALAKHAPGRSHVCELLWDLPNDPRGELRWCLSKLRRLLDEPGHCRVKAEDDRLALDLSRCDVDVAHIARASAQGVATLPVERLRQLARLFTGDFLEGLELDRCPLFESWLIAERRRFRGLHIDVLERFVKSLPAKSEERLAHVEAWIAKAPCDERAHRLLLEALAGHGRMAECEEHLAVTIRCFEREGLDDAPLRDAWRRIKDRYSGSALSITAPADSPEPQSDLPASPRVSLAIMPFVDEAGGGGNRLAHGLTHDIITRLAQLRNLSVIAQGSVFALAERGVTAGNAGLKLDVDYVVTGIVRSHGGRLAVTIDLAEARTGRIVWAETFADRSHEALRLFDEIASRIVAGVAGEIEMAERNRAVLKAPNSLNAWEAYHRGLLHMYRFTQDQNDAARHFFERALTLDPTFSRAYAGLSFTHWQSAFQHWSDRKVESERALAAAGQGLIADEHDPSVHWAMGRALWLHGREDESLAELEKSVDLSPSFALGHYALSFVRAQSGDPRAAIGSSDTSRRLSPFDPLLFAMLSARALAHVRLGEFEEAAVWALKGAARPNAHATIQAIAAHCLALAGRVEDGRRLAAGIRRTLPSYGFDDFRTTFQFPADAEALFRKGAERIGLA
jgi:DNA-binding SARP family transcriptional activator/TolB-like protein